MKGLQKFYQPWKERYLALDKHSRLMTAAAVVGAAITAAWLMLPKGMPSVTGPVKDTHASQGMAKAEAGYFLGEDVDKKAYVERLESQYFSVSEKNQILQGKIDDLAGKVSEMARTQGGISDNLGELERRMADVAAKSAATAGINGLKQQKPVISAYQMDVINIAPALAGERDENVVYLPAGSFVSGTLLTGVYAPSEASNPLPVLVRLKEAFYGPNDTRIPLEGAFAVGKASGDLVSERALVQICTLSAVLPGGQAFEHKGNIGYLTDASGQLGLKGLIVHNTGGQLAMSFMTGFTGGASQAMADAQTTTVVSDSGRMARNVTGNRAKNAGFQGLAQSAAQMSKYYEDQLGHIVPAVKVDAGVDVYFIILEGVAVYGLKKNSISLVRYAD